MNSSLIDDSLTDFFGNYNIFHHTLDLPSENKNLLRKELVITNLEGVDMKDFFLKNIYFVLRDGSYTSNTVEKELMTKVSLRFPNYKKRKIYKEDILDLENFSFKSFNAEQFYKEGITANRIYKDSITATGLEYDKYLEKDKPLIIYRKKIKFDHLIKYNQLTFPEMKVITDSNGETMAVHVRTVPLRLQELISFSDYSNVKLGKGVSSFHGYRLKDKDSIIIVPGESRWKDG